MALHPFNICVQFLGLFKTPQSTIGVWFLWLLFAPLFLIACTNENSPEKNPLATSNNLEPNSVIESRNLIFDHPSKPEGKAARWVSVAENGSDAEFEVVPGGFESSEQSLSVTINAYGGDNRWDVQVYQESVPIEVNKIYEYSVWIKGDRGMLVNVGVESIDYSSIKNKEAYLTGDWQVVAFEFLSSYKNIRTPIHLGFQSNISRTIFIDNVQLKLAN